MVEGEVEAPAEEVEAPIEEEEEGDIIVKDGALQTGFKNKTQYAKDAKRKALCKRELYYLEKFFKKQERFENRLNELAKGKSFKPNGKGY